MGGLQSCLFPSCNCTSGCRPRKVHPGRGSKPSCNQHFFRWDFVEALVGALYVTGGEVHKTTPCLAFSLWNSDRAVTPTRSQNITCITISIIAATIALLTHFHKFNLFTSFATFIGFTSLTTPPDVLVLFTKLHHFHTTEAATQIAFICILQTLIIGTKRVPGSYQTTRQAIRPFCG